MGTAPTKTNSNSTSKPHRDFVIGSILRIAAAASVTLPEATLAIYLEMLINLTPEAIKQASIRTTMEWDRPHMMPPISYILERSGQSPKLRAEQAWEAVQRFVYKNWHPDIGFTSTARLDPGSDYAVRQCGGLARIHDAAEDTFSFIRKDFLQAYERFVVEGGEQVRFSQELAVNTLKEIQNRARALESKSPVVTVGEKS